MSRWDSCQKSNFHMKRESIVGESIVGKQRHFPVEGNLQSSTINATIPRMSANDFLFRNGEPGVLKLEILSHSKKTGLILEMILTNESTKEFANRRNINKNTQKDLQNVLSNAVENRHKYHFCPKAKGSSKKKKKHEDNELTNLVTILNFLDEEHPSASVMIKANITDSAKAKVSGEDHQYILNNFKKMIDIVGGLYAFVTDKDMLKLFEEETRNIINENIVDLEEMHSIISNFSKYGLLQKGRYPPTNHKNLKQARNLRDTWMDLYSTSVKMSLENSYSQKSKRKRGNVNS